MMVNSLSKWATLCIMLWVAVFVNAQDVQFQDIHYTVDENHLTAEVASNPKASGELLIPEKIVVGQNTYTVYYSNGYISARRESGFSIRLR